MAICDIDTAIKYLEDAYRSLPSKSKDDKLNKKEARDLLVSFVKQRDVVRKANAFAGNENLNIYRPTTEQKKEERAAQAKALKEAKERTKENLALITTEEIQPTQEHIVESVDNIVEQAEAAVQVATQEQSVAKELVKEKAKRESLLPRAPKEPYKGRKPNPYSFGKGFLTNDGQTRAINTIKKWYKSSSDNNTFVLQGRGGTGKTATVNILLEELGLLPEEVTFITPTHKAKKVIAKANEKTRFAEGSSSYMTLAGALGLRPKIKNGVEVFEKDPRIQPPDLGKLLIIDEASMIDDEQLEGILRRAKGNKSKIVFMGDHAQLPPVTASDSPIMSKVFLDNKDNTAWLTELMRQGEGSPIINYTNRIITTVEGVEESLAVRVPEERIAQRMQSVVYDDNVFTSYNETNNEGVILSTNATSELLPSFVSDLKNDLAGTKFIGFNNHKHAATLNLVKTIRRELFGKDSETEFLKGEPVIFNKGLTIGDFTIDNGEEFTVESTQETTARIPYKIGKEDHLTDMEIPVRYVTIRSTTDENEVHTVVQAMNMKDMPQLIESEKERLKRVGRNANGAYMVNNFMANEMSYGYVINTHKSQGSSYNTVYLDLGNIMGQRYTSSNDKIKSLYVGASRPRKKLVVVDNRPNSQLSGTKDISHYTDRSNSQGSAIDNSIAEETLKCKGK